MCRTYTALGLPPLVRIPSPDPYAATMALDGGAVGIVSPYTETAEQVAAVGGAVKLRPLRGQRLADATADQSVLEPATSDYVTSGCADNVFIANIESVTAIENLDTILASPYVDALLIGPHDLSVSLGVPEQYDHPDFQSAVSKIIWEARAADAGVGIHFGQAGHEELIRPWMEAGMNMLIYSADIRAFARDVTTFLNDLRSQLGDAAPNSEVGDVVI